MAGGAQGYLVDENGYFLRAGRRRPMSASLPAARPPHADAFTSLGQPTTAATLAMNLPSDDAVGATETYTIDVSDSAAKQHDTTFVHQTGGEYLVADRRRRSDAPLPSPNSGLVFNGTGQLTSPGSYSVAATSPTIRPNPTTAPFTLGVGGFTQFADSSLVCDYQRDGYAPGALSSVTFNERGEVVDQFDSGRTRPLYRLALADFVDPDGLVNSRAMSMPSPRRRDGRWSRTPARRGWARSARKRWKSRTSIWPGNSPG